MSNKKINPRRKPATQADVKRAKATASEDAIRTALYILLYVLVDKHNATKEELRIVQDELNYTADSIKRGYLKWQDIKTMLEEEYDVCLHLG